MGTIWLHEFYIMKLFSDDEFQLCFEDGSVIDLFLGSLPHHFHHFILSLSLPKICVGVSGSYAVCY
jgi:hypothetical protein